MFVFRSLRVVKGGGYRLSVGFFRWVTTSMGESWVFFSRFFHSSPMVISENIPETSAFDFLVRFTRAS